jgi:hypothetical protein
MVETWLIPIYLIVFGAWLFLIRRENGIGAGVRFLYIANLSAQMLFGPIVFWLFDSPEAVSSAALITLLGVAAFVVGAYIVAPNIEAWRKVPDDATPLDLQEHRQIAWRIFAIGLISQMFLARTLGIATLRALAGQTTFLSHSGATLLVLNAIWSRDRRALLTGIGAVFVAAIVAVFATGFASQGLILIFAAVCLWALSERFTADRLGRIFAISLLLLIPYNAWISGRGELRARAEVERLSIEDQLTIFLRNAEWTGPADLLDTEQVERIKVRLDQSRLFALGIEHTPSVEPFAHGRTFFDAIIAMVPRAIWPEKPIVAGGKDFVSQYTGVDFLGIVSVGMHPIFEFYVNFGVRGVIVFLFLFGLLCGFLDMRFAAGLGSIPTQLIVLQISWTVVSSNVMSEFTMSAGATLVVAWIAGWWIRKWRRRGHSLQTEPGHN